jgi:F-type H+-transporting ATPase subunit epsilon
MANEPIHVRINSPEKIIWEGDATSVTSENANGPFDILNFHTNFVSIIRDKEIRVTTGGKVQTFKFPVSVLSAHSNTVCVYTNI